MDYARQLQRHTHTGTDGTSKLDRTFDVSVSLPIADAAAYYTVFWNVPFVCDLIEVRESHTAAGIHAAAVTLNVERLTGTDAPGGGTELIVATSLKSTANTVVTATLTSSREELTLEEGDRLALKLTGTPTSVVGVVVTLKLNRR